MQLRSKNIWRKYQLFNKTSAVNIRQWYVISFLTVLHVYFLSPGKYLLKTLFDKE